MITIRVDEAYAFDFLSILDVKRFYISSVQILYEDYYSEIQDQVDQSVFLNVINSLEYQELVCVNRKIYDTLELLRKGVSTEASVIDNLNTKRYELKTSIQHKYFNSAVSEQKSK